MARLTLSAGMFAAFADSIAALSRRLPLGSPPPCRAATVISRRIFENSFPRWTSVFPFFRLICDHRECPDIAPSPSFLDVRAGGLEPLDALEPTLAPLQGFLPAAALRGRLWHERPTRARTHVRPKVHERQ